MTTMQDDERGFPDAGDAPNKEPAAGEPVPEVPEVSGVPPVPEVPKAFEVPPGRRSASIHDFRQRRPTADAALQPYNEYIEGRDVAALKIRRYRDLQNRRRESVEAGRRNSECALHEATQRFAEHRGRVVRHIVSLRRRLYDRIDRLLAERTADASALVQAQQRHETLQHDVTNTLTLAVAQIAGLRREAAQGLRKLRGVVRAERAALAETASRLEKLQKQTIWYQIALAACLLGYVALVLF